MADDRIQSAIQALKSERAQEFGGAESSAALERVAQAAIAAAEEPDPALTKLSLQAEYAVGKGIISQDELTNLQNKYGAQGDLSLGLLPPFLLMVFAVLVSTDSDLRGWWFALVMVANVSAFLFFLAIERRNKYRKELRLLLLGRIQKQLDADQAAKQAKKDAQKDAAKKDAPDAITKAVQDAISKLKLEVKPLVVQVQTEQPSVKKVDPPAAAPSIAVPNTPPAPPKTPSTGKAE